LLPDIVGSIYITVSDTPTPTTRPEAAFDTICVVFVTTDTTLRRRTTLIYLFDLNPAFAGLIIDEIQQPLVRPVIQPFVAVATPIRVSNTARITYN
jgi:hypothetical protein